MAKVKPRHRRGTCAVSARRRRPGARGPADAVLLDSRNLSLDESLLTGESVAVRKIRRPSTATATAAATRQAAAEPAAEMGPPGGDATPWVFSGTLVVKGQGFARV